MSFGVSTANGSDNGFTTTNGQQQGVSNTKSNTGFGQQGVSTVASQAPLWVHEANQSLYGQNAGAYKGAQQFLQGLETAPYGAASAQNPFSQAISHNFQTQLANANSTDNSLGTPQQGFRQGEALAQAQRDAVGEGQSAANSLLQASNPLANLSFANQLAPQTTTTANAGNTQSTGTTNTSQNTQGAQANQGNSTGSNIGGGFSLCCFIFLEAYNGTLPWYVRAARDAFCTGPRVTGYRRMSTWLVPAMRASRVVRFAVNWSMVKPLSAFGKWLYEGKGHGWLAAPVVAAWFAWWALVTNSNQEKGE